MGPWPRTPFELVYVKKNPITPSLACAEGGCCCPLAACDLTTLPPQLQTSECRVLLCLGNAVPLFVVHYPAFNGVVPSGAEECHPPCFCLGKGSMLCRDGDLVCSPEPMLQRRQCTLYCAGAADGPGGCLLPNTPEESAPLTAQWKRRLSPNCCTVPAKGTQVESLQRRCRTPARVAVSQPASQIQGLLPGGLWGVLRAGVDGPVKAIFEGSTGTGMFAFVQGSTVSCE